MAKIAVLGAGGGLGSNVVREALNAGHHVNVLVRDAARARLPLAVTIHTGDATKVRDVRRAIDGVDAAFFCVNPPFDRWSEMFPPLLTASIDAVRDAGVRLVFPGNVWIFGKPRGDRRIDEAHPRAPCSTRGRLRLELETELERSGVRHTIVRLPEFYGPGVTTLTAPPLRAILDGRRALWFGDLDATVEFVFMPDGARAMLEAGLAPDGDAETVHVPGLHTTPRRFLTLAAQLAGSRSRPVGLPILALAAVGLVHPLARAAADIGHLWTHPVLLDGSRYIARFDAVPQTPYEEGLPQTLEFLRAHPELRLPF